MSEEVYNELDEERWFIDLDWYQSSRRSFSALAQRCLCDKCRKNLKTDGGEIPADKLLATIKDCCSKQPDFIVSELPILESVFRILLKGNCPSAGKHYRYVCWFHSIFSHGFARCINSPSVSGFSVMASFPQILTRSLAESGVDGIVIPYRIEREGCHVMPIMATKRRQGEERYHGAH